MTTLTHIQRTSYSENDFFDVSVVMPFYKKLAVFKKTFQKNNAYFCRNGIEIIICMDDDSEEQGLLDFMKEYPFINLKVLVNREKHSWRNPAKVINVGIRHASFRFVLVMGPDSCFLTDLIMIFTDMIRYFPDSFCIGQVAFSGGDPTGETPSSGFLPYGSIFAELRHFESVGGYNEQFSEWGGDDDEIRARLEYSGLRKLFLPEARLLHLDEAGGGHDQRTKRSREIPAQLRKKIHLPDRSWVNGMEWGKDFEEIIYTYESNPNAYEQLNHYLRQFKTFYIQPGVELLRSRKVVALVPVYNEQKHIEALIQHLETVCDGIILLDDGSTDQTYELACSKKLLVKVKRHRANKIEEFTFRNQLLDIAHFIRSDWFFFMDADERFDPRFCDLYGVTSTALADSVCFYLVHLWNDPGFYRTDVPEKSPIQLPGILHRWRMFRKRGYLQIRDEPRIHVRSVPYKRGKYIAPILILHMGLMDEYDRFAKKELYTKEDPLLELNPEKYTYFIHENISLSAVLQIGNLPARLIEDRDT